MKLGVLYMECTLKIPYIFAIVNSIASVFLFAQGRKMKQKIASRSHKAQEENDF